MTSSYRNGSSNGNGKSKNKTTDRVTIALDEETSFILNKIKKETTGSQSEIFRNALKFYEKYGHLFDDASNSNKKMNIYIDLLSGGEHVILDIDHYLSILRFIEDSDDKEKFWDEHREISHHHADQFKHDIKTFSDVILRLETCNLFKIIEQSPSRYTLLLGSDIAKNFIKLLLEEIIDGMGFKAEVKEGFSKLRVLIENPIA